MQLSGKSVEWLYSNDCAILPFRWTHVNCCPGSCRIPDRGDCSPDRSSDIRFRREPQVDDRSMSLTSLKVPINDGIDDAQCGSSQEAGKDGNACIASQPAKPDCPSRDCQQEQTSRIAKEVTRFPAPLEPTAVVTDRVEHMDWQEEKNKWISAAGVSSPADLERKLADMCSVAAQNEAAMKKLAYHFTEVKTFLQQLQEMDKDVAKRKKRCDRSSRRRKRSRTGSVTVDTQDSSSERLTQRKGGSLLDPQIMRSFGNLIKSSA